MRLFNARNAELHDWLLKSATGVWLAAIGANEAASSSLYAVSLFRSNGTQVSVHTIPQPEQVAESNEAAVTGKTVAARRTSSPPRITNLFFRFCIEDSPFVNGQRTSWYFLYFIRHLFIEYQFYWRFAGDDKKARVFFLWIFSFYPGFVIFDKGFYISVEKSGFL
jgi:hypothetical protein